MTEQTTKNEGNSQLSEQHKNRQVLLDSLFTSKNDQNLLTSGELSSHSGEYPFVVDHKIANVSDKSLLTFGLESIKNIVLGDSASFKFMNGINLDVNLTFAGEDKKSAENLSRISLAGIAEKVALSSTTLNKLDLDDVPPSNVALPNMTQLELSYGNINTATSQRLLGVEFMPPKGSGDSIDLSLCKYANFRLITKTVMTKADLEQVSLVSGLKSTDNDFDGYLQNDKKLLFEGYNKVKVTDTLKADIGITQAGPGVNIVQYQSGIGRIAYEEMIGMSKTVSYATDQYSLTYCKGSKFTVVCAPHLMESQIMVNVTKNEIRMFNTSSVALALDLTTTLCGLKAVTNFGNEVENFTGLKLEKRFGAAVIAGPELAFKSSVVDLEKAVMRIQEELTRVDNIVLGISAKKADVATTEVCVANGGVRVIDTKVSINVGAIHLIS